MLLLDDLKSITFDKFRSDPKIFKLAQYCIQLCIQCLLDICHHIIVEMDWPRPKDNKEAILTLSRNGVLPNDFAERITPMVGLRNILVHEYLKIDLDKIYSQLQKLEDFRAFQKHIIAFLKTAK